MANDGGHQRRRDVDKRSKLRLARKAMGLSAKEASRHIGCNYAVLLRIERGDQLYVSCELKRNIADFFGLEFKEINETI